MIRDIIFDRDGGIDWFITGVLAFCLIVGLVTVGFATPGVGTPRSDSTYTGHVVDVQYESGFLLKNTYIHMKTHPQASESEVFCVAVPDDESYVEEGRQALRNDQRVTVEYKRGIIEDPRDCKADNSLVTDIEIADNSTSSAS